MYMRVQSIKLQIMCTGGKTNQGTQFCAEGCDQQGGGGNRINLVCLFIHLILHFSQFSMQLMKAYVAETSWYRKGLVL